MMTALPTIADAARNNAEWCDAMCRAHGTPGTFTGDAWSTATRSPAFYPDAVTLGPGVAPEAVLHRVDAGPGCSIKDSFATLDLTRAGFRVLFVAEWIGRTAAAPAPTHASWPRVTGPEALHEWERRWARPAAPTGLFRAGLLDDANVVVVGDETGGAVLSRSAQVVGVSNVFDRAGDLDAAWHNAFDAVGTHFPGRAIVGYESGADLAAARRAGFDALGRLRVWMKD
jgi:hypothetical protein